MQKTNKSGIWDEYQVGNRNLYLSKSGLNDPTFYFIKYLIKKKTIKTNNILEIGFGNGLTLQLLSKVFNKVSGADISPKNIELTKKEFEGKNIKNADFFVLDLVKPLQLNKTYDVVMLNHVLEHFTKEELDNVIPNILKLLNPRGKIIGAVPLNLPLTYRICPNCGEKFEIDGHLFTYNKDVFRNNIIKYGFKEIILRTYNFDFNSRNDNFLKKFVRKCYYNITKKPNTQLEFCIEKR